MGYFILKYLSISVDNYNGLIYTMVEDEEEIKKRGGIKMTKFERVERELVVELEKRGLEFRGEGLEMAAEYIITTRTVKPEYSVTQYIKDTLSYYPEMFDEE